jgi:glycosyltransferase involved in cell wall biosynthesis
VRLCDTAEDFAAALVALLTDDDARERLGHAARGLVRERYTAERMVARFETLYASGLLHAGAA